MPLTLTNELPAGLTSSRRAVPAVVPSVVHGSVPWTPSSAWKNNRVPTRTNGRDGSPDEGPGLMSLTSDVPAAVPSLRQGSQPLVASHATKTSVVPRLARKLGDDAFGPTTMSRTVVVPAAVPLLLHSSVPCEPSSAGKYSTPFTACSG